MISAKLPFTSATQRSIRKNVGFESNQNGNHFLFKTVDDKGVPISGNSNKGHSGNSFTKNLGEDGQWRDFTDDERYQLIEYMKTL